MCTSQTHTSFLLHLQAWNTIVSPLLYMKVLTEIAEKNAQREQEMEHFVWEEVMEIHYGKNKKGKEEKVKRKEQEKIMLNLLSRLNPSVITSYWHTRTDALSMQYSQKQTHTHHKANKSLHRPSFTGKMIQILPLSSIKKRFFNVSVCCWNEVTSRLLERHCCSYKIIWTDEKLPGYISAEAYWLTLFCSLFITNFIGQYKTSFGHPGFNGVH